MGNVKKLVSSIPVGLMPVYKSDLQILQDNLWNGVQAITKAFDPGYSYVLQGMVASVIGGTDLHVTEGYWWRHDSNEIIYFPGGTLSGSLAGSITKSTSVNSTKVYKDGSTQVVYSETVSVLGASLISPPTNAINIFSTGTTQTLIQVIQSLTNKNGSWTNVAFQNSWSNNGLQYVQYRKNSNGLIMLRGQAQHTGASSATIFTLPAGFRPVRDMNLIALVSGVPTALFVGADGQVVSSSATLIWFDGLSFTND